MDTAQNVPFISPPPRKSQKKIFFTQPPKPFRFFFPIDDYHNDGWPVDFCVHKWETCKCKTFTHFFFFSGAMNSLNGSLFFVKKCINEKDTFFFKIYESCVLKKFLLACLFQCHSVPSLCLQMSHQLNTVMSPYSSCLVILPFPFFLSSGSSSFSSETFFCSLNPFITQFFFLC